MSTSKETTIPIAEGYFDMVDRYKEHKILMPDKMYREHGEGVILKLIKDGYTVNTERKGFIYTIYADKVEKYNA